VGCAGQGRANSYLKTVMDKEYIALVRLLIEAAPSIFERSPFALKGGTAINLFAADMPRLSVDLDLVFVDHRVEREEALRIISDSLASAREKLRHLGIDADLVASKSGEESKLFLHRGQSLVKVEANHVFRGTVLPVEHRAMVPAARDLFATGLSLPTLAVSELYGSKLVAAMDRQHPRDLFDVHGLYSGVGLAPV
jgi:predicted nucleotidyltransferase component of viral defense system